MDEPTRDELIEACREELSLLWTDLHYAIGSALDGRWSISCDHIKQRIQKLTKLVGPTPWEEILWDLLESGLYQEVHQEIGVEVNPDMERVAAGRAYMAGTRSSPR